MGQRANQTVWTWPRIDVRGRNDPHLVLAQCVCCGLRRFPNPADRCGLFRIRWDAAYYDWLPAERVSNPIWVIFPIILILIPVGMVVTQPDLGTSLLLLFGGGAMMFLAGVHWAYFASVIAIGAGGIVAIFQSRGQTWQLLNDYQYRRIDTFLDPASDPDAS